jgi:N-acetyl sugar amidotransferase
MTIPVHGRPYRVCSFCVMDSSIPAINFDGEGRCDCCRQALARQPYEWLPSNQGRQQLNQFTEKLKQHGRGQKYDCMIGLSGGVDSAYLAHLAVRELGLRVLAVHVDAGWNSAAAVRNIELIVRKLDLDLHTYVVEWSEMQDIQLAFLRASVLNQDNPQDHAFFSTLYRTAMQRGIRYFLSGVNFATENIIPPSWGHPYMDVRQIRAIHHLFGRRPLHKFPFMSLPEFIWKSRVARVLTVHRPLNYIPYNKEVARRTLEENYGWVNYGGKHHESRFTKFYQQIYLPEKFGFDKRRLHLSSLIVSGNLGREEALQELDQPIIDPIERLREIRFIAKKLAITAEELLELIAAEPVSHLDYPNHLALNRLLVRLKRLVGSGTGTA